MDPPNTPSRPVLEKLRPTDDGSRRTARAAIAVAVVAIAAFVLGVRFGSPSTLLSPSPTGSQLVLASPPPQTNSIASIANSPSPRSSASAVSPAATGDAVAPTPTLGLVPPPSAVPAGVYHLTQLEASEVAVFEQFLGSYNAGQLDSTLSWFTTNASLDDCDYTERTVVSLQGRSSLQAYLVRQFATHDRWAFEIYNEDPANDHQLVLFPVTRSNDVLRNLGLVGGVKSEFRVVFFVEFDQQGLQIAQLNLATLMPGADLARYVCTP